MPPAGAKKLPPPGLDRGPGDDGNDDDRKTTAQAVETLPGEKISMRNAAAVITSPAPPHPGRKLSTDMLTPDTAIGRLQPRGSSQGGLGKYNERVVLQVSVSTARWPAPRSPA